MVDPWVVAFTISYVDKKVDALPVLDDLNQLAVRHGSADYTVVKQSPQYVVRFRLPSRILAAKFACDALLSHTNIVSVHLNPED